MHQSFSVLSIAVTPHNDISVQLLCPNSCRNIYTIENEMEGNEKEMSLSLIGLPFREERLQSHYFLSSLLMLLKKCSYATVKEP